VTGASLTTHWVFPKIEMFGRGMDGKWLRLADNAKAEPRPMNLWKSTILNLKRAGFEYIVTPIDGTVGNGTLGKVLFERGSEWGVVRMAGIGNVWLLKL
jgi:hypothetical protein